MKKEKIHELKQTVFGGRIIDYYLLYESNNSYGIEIMLKSKNKNEDLKISDISKDKNIVVNLIKYLYENSVDTIHFKDIVEDYVASI